MPGIAPVDFKTRAGIKEEPSDYEPSWMKVPFDDYDGMTQQQFQDSVGPFLVHGSLVKVDVPKGWRRVESSRPGKHFYIHMATGAISAFPKEMYDVKQEQWLDLQGKVLPEQEVCMDPVERAFKLAYPNGVPPDPEPEKVAAPEKGAGREAARSSAALKDKPAASPATAPAQASRLPVGLLFPGQGSQYVKMLGGVKDLPKVREMLDRAKDILGYDLEDICLKGPEEKLERTEFCQPALFVGGLAALEKLRIDKPDRVEQCQAVAGLSLGEYTALTVAGVFDFETGLRLVALRGKAMQEAAEASQQLMLSVAGLPQDTLSKLCAECCESESDVCQIANFLFPNGFACAGTAAAVQRLEGKAKEAGALQAKLLKTSGGFHTSLMQPAKDRLLEALRNVEGQMKPPRCDVYMNTIGNKITAATPASEIVNMLGDQLVSCVLWEPSMKRMIADGISEFYECGPMKQLKAMMKRIDPNVMKNTTNIDV